MKYGLITSLPHFYKQYTQRPGMYNVKITNLGTMHSCSNFIFQGGEGGGDVSMRKLVTENQL
jgi:hypothetical protein